MGMKLSQEKTPGPYCLALFFGIWLNAWSITFILDPAEQIAVNLAGGERQARHLSIAEIQSSLGNNRAEVIAILQQVESGHENVKNHILLGADARVALLKLNDRPTVEKIMSNFLEYQSGKLGDYSEDIAASSQPLLISDLAKHLFLPASAYDAYEKERVKHAGGDVTQTSPVFLADGLIILIVRDSDQFSEATREWARTMWRTQTKQGKVREILRVWWNKNKQLIQSGNFGAVKPGDLGGHET